MSNESKDPQNIETEVFGDQLDSGELELLKSRVDEQGKLICFLKRRTDDQLVDNKSLNTQYEDLRLLKEETDEDLENLRTHCAMLENRLVKDLNVKTLKLKLLINIYVLF